MCKDKNSGLSLKKKPDAARDEERDARPEIDPADYLADLDGLDMDEAAKIELLTILRDILSHFVQTGIDLKKVDVCGQLFGDFTDAAADRADGVESNDFTEPETPADQTNDEDSE